MPLRSEMRPNGIAASSCRIALRRRWTDVCHFGRICLDIASIIKSNDDMRSLDLDAVNAFVLVADLRSFTRAAQALGTTQAAVSLKLKRLEDRLGRRLVERTPRTVRLSGEGAAFIERARDLLRAQERALADLLPAPKRLTLGISDHAAGAELPLLLSRIDAQRS